MIRAQLALARFEWPLAAAGSADELAVTLSASEQAYLARVERPIRRMQFTVARRVLQWLLAQSGLGAAAVEVGDDGRPLVASSAPAYASIAHSGDAVAVVLAGDPVGVDIEAARVFADPAAAAAAINSAGNDSAAVLRAWVASEARLKAGERAANAVYRTTWDRYELAVAGVNNPPLTGVLDVLTGTYNAAGLNWARLIDTIVGR